MITGASQDVTSRILEARSRAFASPDVGAMLPQLLSEAGFRDVRTSEFHLVTTKVDVAMRVFRLEANVDAAVTGGTISSAEARSWLQALTAAHQWRAFGAQVIGYLVSGTRPAGTQSETCSMR